MQSRHLDERVIELGGRAYRILGRAWWLETACVVHDGRVAVARIHAQSLVMRKPSAEQLAADPSLNRNWLDANNRGELANYMLNLTDGDLAELGIEPGWLVGAGMVVDGERPRTNRSHEAVAMWRQQSQTNLQGLGIAATG